MLSAWSAQSSQGPPGPGSRTAQVPWCPRSRQQSPKDADGRRGAPFSWCNSTVYRAWHWASLPEPRPHGAPRAAETTGAQQAQSTTSKSSAVPFTRRSFLHSGARHQPQDGEQQTVWWGHPHGAQSAELHPLPAPSQSLGTGPAEQDRQAKGHGSFDRHQHLCVSS